MLNPSVLYEDDDIMAIDKPSGYISNDASTTANQPVIQTWLRKTFKYPLIGEINMRDGIVHRLDKETSGVLLVAKNEGSFFNLQAQFKDREIEKEYTALVHGKTETAGTINAEVGRLPWRRDRFGVLPGGRTATTLYKTEGYFKRNGNDLSLVTAKPKTGRTHQIRIHFKHIGRPIVADTFYAGRKTSRSDRVWCPRLFLHAGEISFKHPASGNVMHISSPLPSDLKDVLESLTTIS